MIGSESTAKIATGYKYFKVHKNTIGEKNEKNRQKFYDVRIESLELAVKQINTMYKQIQINYTILPPNIFEAPLVRKERLTIQSTVDLLNQMIVLLKSVNLKS